MICTLTKLSYPKLSSTQCGGWLENIGVIQDRKDSVKALLSLHKCLGGRQDISKFDLLTNRLSPYQMKVEALDNIDICQNHFVSI